LRHVFKEKQPSDPSLDIRGDKKLKGTLELVIWHVSESVVFIGPELAKIDDFLRKGVGVMARYNFNFGPPPSFQRRGLELLANL
jgi:hypothetical protein